MFQNMPRVISWLEVLLLLGNFSNSWVFQVAMDPIYTCLVQKSTEIFWEYTNNFNDTVQGQKILRTKYCIHLGEFAYIRA